MWDNLGLSTPRGDGGSRTCVRSALTRDSAERLAYARRMRFSRPLVVVLLGCHGCALPPSPAAQREALQAQAERDAQHRQTLKRQEADERKARAQARTAIREAESSASRIAEAVTKGRLRDGEAWADATGDACRTTFDFEACSRGEYATTEPLVTRCQARCVTARNLALSDIYEDAVVACVDRVAAKRTPPTCIFQFPEAVPSRQREELSYREAACVMDCKLAGQPISPSAGPATGGGMARCCDGSTSRTCACPGHGGCCSSHGGVCGCAN